VTFSRTASRSHELLRPLHANAHEAELIWQSTRADLRELGLRTTRRRIAALSLHPDLFELVAVGEDTPDGDLVMVILEASDLDIFAACPEPAEGCARPTTGCWGACLTPAG
jgi:hypothetical protein